MHRHCSHFHSFSSAAACKSDHSYEIPLITKLRDKGSSERSINLQLGREMNFRNEKQLIRRDWRRWKHFQEGETTAHQGRKQQEAGRRQQSLLFLQRRDCCFAAASLCFLSLLLPSGLHSKHFHLSPLPQCEQFSLPHAHPVWYTGSIWDLFYLILPFLKRKDEATSIGHHISLRSPRCPLLKGDFPLMLNSPLFWGFSLQMLLIIFFILNIMHVQSFMWHLRDVWHDVCFNLLDFLSKISSKLTWCTRLCVFSAVCSECLVGFLVLSLTNPSDLLYIQDPAS